MRPGAFCQVCSVRDDMTSIYLDHNSTTPLDPEVRDEMVRCLDRVHGNPSSIHQAGQEARRVIDTARARVARCIGALPEEILFTSGGTESNNLAILGMMSGTRDAPRHLVSTAIEHQAVLNPCRHLERCGMTATYLPVDGNGTLTLSAVEPAIRPETALISVMLVNNDIGTIQPVAEVASLARARGIAVHTDAVQAMGKIPVSVKTLGVDLLSLSAHKLHGPKGVGALYLRKGTSLTPLVFGGHQERGLRPGTENVPAIAGFGKACELASSRLTEDAIHVSALRDQFEQSVLDRLPWVRVNGGDASRSPNTSSLHFADLSAEMVTINLDLLGVAVSTGAACSSADNQPSHVLLAMGRSPEDARSSVRFSFGRTTTVDEVARAVELLVQAVGMMTRGGR
jgi:cysteine desulfurase